MSTGSSSDTVTESRPRDSISEAELNGILRGGKHRSSFYHVCGRFFAHCTFLYLPVAAFNISISCFMRAIKPFLQIPNYILKGEKRSPQNMRSVHTRKSQKTLILPNLNGVVSVINVRTLSPLPSILTGWNQRMVGPRRKHTGSYGQESTTSSKRRQFIRCTSTRYHKRNEDP